MFSTYITDPVKAFNATKEFLREYVIKYKLNSLVIGISGGADSTLVACIAHEAIKDLDEVRVLGYSLPTKSNKPSEIKRAEDVLDAFCDYGETFDILPIVNATLQAYGLGSEDKLIIDPCDATGDITRRRAGNIKCRERMKYLYDSANQFNGVVLSTDNYTEFQLGFFTKNGDVGDVGPIQHMWKSEVYDVMLTKAEQYTKEGDIQKAKTLLDGVSAKPTDGLGVSETDFDQFGFTSDILQRLTPAEVYRLVEDVLIEYQEAIATNDKIAMRDLEQNQIIQLHLNSTHKRQGEIILDRRLLL